MKQNMNSLDTLHTLRRDCGPPLFALHPFPLGRRLPPFDADDTDEDDGDDEEKASDEGDEQPEGEEDYVADEDSDEGDDEDDEDDDDSDEDFKMV